MYSTKIFSNLCCFVSLILFATGLYLKLENISSSGWQYRTRLGTSMEAETINGNGTIFFGLIILIASIISNRVYIAQKKDSIKRKELENK